MFGLDFILKIGETFVNNWTDGQKNKRAIQAAVATNKIRLAQSEQSHNSAWEMAQLAGKDNLLRRVSFLLLSIPFVVAIFNPQAVQAYFTIAIASVPDWYQWAYVSILGAIWGLSSFKNFRGK